MNLSFLVVLTFHLRLVEVVGSRAQHRIFGLFQTLMEEFIFHQFVLSTGTEALPLSSVSCSIIESIESYSYDDDYHFGRYNLSVLVEEYQKGVNPLGKRAHFLRQTGGNRVLTLILLSESEDHEKIVYLLTGFVTARDNPEFLLFFVGLFKRKFEILSNRSKFQVDLTFL